LAHKVNGKTYDLLWVSSVQGLPYGMEDYLQDMGWVNIGTDCNKVQAGHAIITTGSDGPHSHTIVGVGPKLADAHNAGHLHTNPCFYTVEAIYAPPGGLTPPAPVIPVNCKAIYTTNTDLNLRASGALTGNILQVIPSGSKVYDISGTTTPSGGYNWRNVNFNGQVGFVADSLITLVGQCPANTQFCVNASPNLRLRNGPCTTAAQISTVPTGASVTSLSATLTAGCGYNWRKITYNGDTGYAANEFLQACTKPIQQFVNTTVDVGACTTHVGSASALSLTLATVLYLAVVFFAI